MTEINQILLNFYRAWLIDQARAMRGEQTAMQVKDKGLCSLLANFSGSGPVGLEARRRQKAELRARYSGADFPFMGHCAVSDAREMEDQRAHLNPRREAFVRDMVKRLEELSNENA